MKPIRFKRLRPGLNHSSLISPFGKARGRRSVDNPFAPGLILAEISYAKAGVRDEDEFIQGGICRMRGFSVSTISLIGVLNIQSTGKFQGPQEAGVRLHRRPDCPSWTRPLIPDIPPGVNVPRRPPWSMWSSTLKN